MGLIVEESTKMSVPKLVWPAGATLGEGPVWVDRESALYWVDIKGQAVHRMTWPGTTRQSWRTDSPVGAIQPTTDGRFIGAFKDGIRLVELDPESDRIKTELITNPEPELPDNRFNDGKIGPDGAFWAGTMDDRESQPTGSLYRLTHEGACVVVDSGYVVTNGPAFSPDGKTLYHTDTFGRVIYAFELGSSGRVGGKRRFVEIPDSDGYPDGMCVDDEGCIWVAHWAGWRLTRFSPEGKPVTCLDMPVSQVTSCVFGGVDLKTMFITSAAVGLSASELAGQPDAGGLYAVELDIGGPLTRYFDWRE